MTKFENFNQLDQLVGNQLNRFDVFQLKFIIRACSNSERPSFFWSYLPHLNLELHAIFFVGLLILQDIFYQIFSFFFLKRLD